MIQLTAKGTHAEAAEKLQQRQFVKIRGHWYWVLTPTVRVEQTRYLYTLSVQVLTRENRAVWLPLYEDELEVMDEGKTPGPWRPSKLRNDAERLKAQAQQLLARASGLAEAARGQEYRLKG